MGYPKHPPLLASMLWGWFKIFPLADWSYLLLSAVTLAAGIWLAIELSAEWLSGDEARRGAVPARRDPVLQFPRFEMGPELDADPALGARHVGDAACARHAPRGLGGARGARGGRRDAVEILVGISCSWRSRSRRSSHPRRRDYFRSARAVGDGGSVSCCHRTACGVADPRGFSADHLGGDAAHLGIVRRHDALDGRVFSPARRAMRPRRSLLALFFIRPRPLALARRISPAR